MSDHHQTIVDCEVSLAAAAAAGEEIRQWLLAEGIVRDEKDQRGWGYAPGPNWRRVLVEFRPEWEDTRDGLCIVVGRTVFDCGENFQGVFCPKCGWCANVSDRHWGDAVGEWYSQSGPGTMTCPACGHSESITNWRFEWPFGFGNLGFEFWNWPPLKESFLAEFQRRLGHRTVLVRGQV